MHTFREVEKGVKWVVGYWMTHWQGGGDELEGNTKWHSISEHQVKSDAMNEVNVLNGGNYYVHVENLDTAPAQAQDAA